MSREPRVAEPFFGVEDRVEGPPAQSRSQVQRYESTGYRSASLARICDIAVALDVTITERVSLRGPDAA